MLFVSVRVDELSIGWCYCMNTDGPRYEVIRRTNNRTIDRIARVTAHAVTREKMRTRRFLSLPLAWSTVFAPELTNDRIIFYKFIILPQSPLGGCRHQRSTTEPIIFLNVGIWNQKTSLRSNQSIFVGRMDRPHSMTNLTVP
jgi:hypothetical protein